MSEEPEVSPLRLKRPGAGGPSPTQPPAAPASGTPAPASSPFTSASEAPLMPLPGMPSAPAPDPAPTPANPSAGDASHAAPVLRRRPTLATESGTAHAAPPPASATPPAGPDLAAAPAAPSPPAFKLKVGTRPLPPLPPLPPITPASGAGPAPFDSDILPPLEDSPGGAPLAPLPGLPSGGMMIGGLPPTPPLAPLPAGAQAGFPPPDPSALAPRVPIHLRAEAPAEVLDPAKLPPALPARAAKAAVGRSHARRDALVFALVFLLVAGAGAGAYFYFTKKDVALDSAALTEKLNQAAKLPGKMVDDAKNALAGAREKEQARIDAATDGKETPSERAIGNVTPAELSANLQAKNAPVPVASPAAGNPPPPTPPAQSVTAYAGENPAGALPVATPQASARFLRYAESIRVSGVFQGSPARALVDGRLIREGDVVEPMLGIKFADLDPDAKQLVLQDATGAQVRVKY